MKRINMSISKVRIVIHHYIDISSQHYCLLTYPITYPHSYMVPTSSIHKTPGFFLVFIWIFIVKNSGVLMHNIERQNHKTVHLERQTGWTRYSAGEEKSPLFIFLHDQLPLFLGEIVENFSRFLQEIQYFLQEIPVFLPEILGLYL